MSEPASERVSVLAASRAALAAREGGAAVAVVARVEEGRPVARVLVYADSHSGTLGDAELDRAAIALGRELLESGDAASREARSSSGETLLYGEAHRPLETLWVVGAGHIARPLVEVAATLGFRVLVLDDRDDFATDERFPGAASVRRVDFADPFADGGPGPHDYVVLVTRAHRYDFDCLSRLVQGDDAPRYIGMVGSRRRVRAALSALLEAGVPRSSLTGVRAPIGLDIGAETPEEIAVAIAAELVAERRGVEAGGALSRKERVLDRLLP